MIDIASGGVAQATAASAENARIWGVIAHALDGNLSKLACKPFLDWMPAHQPPAAIGTRALASGRLMRAVGWRANRLADQLALRMAMEDAARNNSAGLLASAAKAVEYVAALLGVVTHAANNCSMWVQQADGSAALKSVRDAAGGSRGQWTRRTRPQLK